MNPPRRQIEVNEPARRTVTASEFRQHLVSASNELYLHELLCNQQGLEVSPALKRAHAAIRAELKRLEAEEKREEP